MAETLETLGEKLTAGLAAMARRFDTVDQRLEGVDRRLAEVDRRFDGVDQQLAGIAKQFESFDNRFEGVAKQFESVDKRFDQLGSSLRTQIEAVDNKVGLVLEKVQDVIERDVHHSGVNARVETRLDNHELRLIALESKKRQPR